MCVPRIFGWKNSPLVYYILICIFDPLMMMNCFCKMVEKRKAFSIISSWDHCQRFSPLFISKVLWVGFEPANNLNSGFFEGSCAEVIYMIFIYYIYIYIIYETLLSIVIKGQFLVISKKSVIFIIILFISRVWPNLSQHIHFSTRSWWIYCYF